MSIFALPPATVRLLGSSAALTAPCALVKELVDNAIDAQATCVEVIVSPNTIDKICVRDDGVGISVNDFDALGRRGHTSKLRNFDELQAIAGTTLGFRGEALASANTLSTITITTRTKDDPVASRMQIRRVEGGVQDRRPVSAPVGTTVQATKLFENIPIRRQIALKESQKTISRISCLLKGHVMARPYLRISFKIGGDAKLSWSYAPVVSSTLNEAALQLFGQSLASSCVEISQSSYQNQNVTYNPADNDMESTVTLEALLPKSDCNTDAIKGKGAFISVDLRPLSSTSGLPKKIANRCKTALSQAIGVDGSSKPLVNPFLRLNICFGRGSYDPNVSPLKDEVLFTNEASVLDTLERLLDKIYKRCQPDLLNEENSIPPKRPAVMLPSNTPTSHMLEDDGFMDEEDKNLADMFLLNGPETPPLKTSTRSTAWREPNEQSNTNNTKRQENFLKATTLMRTHNEVRMDRTDSNATEEDGTLGLIEVQVPPQQPLIAASKTNSTQSRSAFRLSRSAAASKASGIERYLIPKGGEEFQIASDDTATTREQRPKYGSRSSSNMRENVPSRAALQPLSASTLNRTERLIDLESDPSNSDMEVAEAEFHSRADPFMRLASDLASEDDIEVQNMNTAIPGASLPRSGLNERITASSPIHSSLLSTPGERTLVTPPPSNPLRRERLSTQLFRPPQMAASATVRAGNSRSRDRGTVGNSGRAGSLSQSRVSVTPAMESQPALRHHANNGLNRVGTAPTLRDIRERHRRSGIPEDRFFQSASQLPGVLQNNACSSGNPDVHASQMLVMRNPSLPYESKGKEKLHGCAGDDSQDTGLVTLRHNLWCESKGGNISLNTSMHTQGEEPQSHLFRRQHSQSRSSQMKRSHSETLPLGTIQADCGTHNLSQILSLQLRDLENWMSQHAWLYRSACAETRQTPPNAPERLQPPEKRLREDVDAWTKKRTPFLELEAEYVLCRTQGEGRG